MINNGFIPKKIKDHRNYSFHRTFGVVDKRFLDKELNYDAGLTMPDQNAEGLYLGCTGETTTDIATDWTGKKFDAGFTYRKTCAMEGHGPEKGCQIQNSLKSAADDGLQEAGKDETEALLNRRGKRFEIEKIEGYDWFDSLRSALVLNPKRSISVGTPWFREWDAMMISDDGLFPNFVVKRDNDPWHNWKISGIAFRNGEYKLIGKSWQGARYGDKGFHYIGREAFNAVMAINGTEAWVQARAEAEDIKKIQMDMITKIISYLVQLLALIGAQNTPKTPPEIEPLVPLSVKPPEPVLVVAPKPPITPAPVPVPPKYLFDTVQNSRHSIRVICDEMGLSLYNKEVICACIEEESQFKNFRSDGTPMKRDNIESGKVWSTDWGICQINDYWHVVKYHDFPSAQYIIDNPEKAVRFMVSMLKAGQIKAWVSYSSGAYLKHMPTNLIKL